MQFYPHELESSFQFESFRPRIDSDSKLVSDLFELSQIDLQQIN